MEKFKNLLFKHAAEDNQENILSMAARCNGKTLLDLGCDTGTWTSRLISAVGPDRVFGIDIEAARLSQAKRLLHPVKSDLNAALPFKSGSIDIIHSNQVIEHLSDVDLFCEETYRVLKPGGCVLISTENLSSWHNIFALVIGRQAFSQHISNRINLGNPMSLHHGEDISKSWAHVKIFTYHGLKALFSHYRFKNIKIRGAGYYPFWGSVSRAMSRIDSRHTHFITLKAYK